MCSVDVLRSDDFAVDVPRRTLALGEVLTAEVGLLPVVRKSSQEAGDFVTESFDKIHIVLKHQQAFYTVHQRIFNHAEM